MNLHKNEEYVVRQPVKFGHLNTSPTYQLTSCLDDLSTIIEKSVSTTMKLPASNFKHFNCILVVPDSMVKLHVRYMIGMLFKLGFKQIFCHVESVLSTYAMALPTAVVVDVGATKTSVCCIEEGIIIHKSIIRKHFGGDDMTLLLLRLL